LENATEDDDKTHPSRTRLSSRTRTARLDCGRKKEDVQEWADCDDTSLNAICSAITARSGPVFSTALGVGPSRAVPMGAFFFFSRSRPQPWGYRVGGSAAGKRPATVVLLQVRQCLCCSLYRRVRLCLGLPELDFSEPSHVQQPGILDPRSCCSCYG